MNVIGLDLGTTTLSAVVLECDTDTVLETLNVPNTAVIPSAKPWEGLQDPACIAALAEKMVEELKMRHDVSAIGIDGQMHGILYIDAQGEAVSPLYTWQDQRGEQSLEDTTYAARLSALTGYSMATGYGMTTHFWHTVNACIPEKAVCLCTVYDYVGMKLTGRRTPLMHVSSAASLGLFRIRGGAWDVQAVLAAGMDARYLPEISDACAVIGKDRDGLPVSCGIGDNQASFIGSVSQMEGSLLINMGTGGQVSMLAPVQKGNPNVEVRPLGEGRNILVGSVLCGGRSYAMLEKFLCSCADLAGCKEKSLYEAMNQTGMRMLETDRPMQVDTRFRGTRSQPELRGAIGNIGPENFDAAHLIGGTLLGMAQEMYGLYEEMLTLGAPAACRIIGSGNAIRKNPALKRAFEKVFGMEMHIPKHTEEAACGAALFAMAAAAGKPSLPQTQKRSQ